MARLEDTEEYKRGSIAEHAIVEYLLENGHTIVPMYGKLGNDPTTKAPLAFSRGGTTVLPDLLVFEAKTGTKWIECKAKTRPGYFRKDEMYTHGIDYDLMEHYERIQRESGHRVYLVVAEESGPEGSPGAILAISLDDANSAEGAHHSQNWPRPGGAGSRRGKGGWIWPRAAMFELWPKRGPVIH